MIDKNTFTKKNISSTLDKHKVWLIIGISIAVLAILFLFLYSPVKKAIYGEAVGENCYQECEFGIDDGDGLLCCEDPDCSGYSSGTTDCAGGFEVVIEICNNGIDDDGDRLVDCNDPGCASDPSCQADCSNCGVGLTNPYVCMDTSCGTGCVCDQNLKKTETICNDNTDNDGNEGIDCADPDCVSNPVCQTTCSTGQTLCSGICVNLETDSSNCASCGNACGVGQSCVKGVCTTPAEICNNRLDDDGDGLVDCDDPNCALDTICNPVVEICNNNIDDNSNGLTGCNDPDCFSDPACQTTCSTGQTLCSSACVNLETDSGNCGICGHVCGEGQSCVSGVCTTPAPTTNPCTENNWVCGILNGVDCGSCAEDYECSNGQCVWKTVTTACGIPGYWYCTFNENEIIQCDPDGSGQWRKDVVCPPGTVRSDPNPDNTCSCVALAILGDTDGNGCVSITELLSYIGLWKSNQVDMTDLLKAIGNWKNPAAGCSQ